MPCHVYQVYPEVLSYHRGGFPLRFTGPVTNTGLLTPGTGRRVQNLLGLDREEISIETCVLFFQVSCFPRGWVLSKKRRSGIKSLTFCLLKDGFTGVHRRL